MSKKPKNHAWSADAAPPIIRPHSQAKHRVIRNYLERYVSVLTARPQQDHFRLTLVDGFAGGGIYLDSRSKEEHFGSPMIMLQAMKAAGVAAQAQRTKEFHLDVDYFFVEQDVPAYERLKKEITKSEFKNLLENKIRVLNADFVSQIPMLISHIRDKGRSGRAIFVLDQFGYSDVPLPEIKQILASLPNAEIILTFAVDSLIDYLSTNQLTQDLLAKVGVSIPSIDIENAKTSRNWKRAIQLALHKEIPLKTGAKYYTPFFIRSNDAHRDFWLIHLSGHHRARDVMVGLHWDEHTDFAHYGGAGLKMLGYNEKNDESLTRQPTLPGFFFDETARAVSQQELFDQLPSRVHPFKDGVTFEDFFAKVTNETPATSEIMKEILDDLAAEGLIEVRDKNGTVKRHARVTKDSDIILPHRQKRLSFGK